MGIATLGPDVNESYQKFGVNKKGEIRFGLAAIKGMGDAAAQAIINEREQNGQYKDIYDFARRVNLNSVNRRAFESLALSGGFDSFNIPRENFFAIDSKGTPFLDVLLRYGQLYQMEKFEAQHSLFGDSDEIEIANPPIPQGEPWSTIEKLNRERELVGIYLSAHPLDDYRIVLNNLCNSHCSELADKENLLKKNNITIGGIVTSVKSKFTKKGNPCGFVTLEDYEGNGELALFGEDWGKWKGMLSEGCTVFITAQSVPRFRDSNILDLRVIDIQYMQTVKDERIESFTITIDSAALDETMVTDISSMVADSPGKTRLLFQINDKEHNTNIMLRSATKSIYLKNDLLSYIECHDGMSYHVN